MSARILVPGTPEVYYNYGNALLGCGAEPVFGGDPLHPSGTGGCDGLLIPGGGDVNPARYGEKNTASADISDERDAWEFALIRAYFAAGKPILGICRGHQVINVAFGGSLIQHVDSAQRHARCGESTDKVHRAALTENGFLRALYGTAEIAVNSAHHQAVKRLAPDFCVQALSDDGLIEAIAHQSAPVYGVQFHPERMSFAHRRDDTADGRPVIEWFVKLCLTAQRKG